MPDLVGRPLLVYLQIEASDFIDIPAGTGQDFFYRMHRRHG